MAQGIPGGVGLGDSDPPSAGSSFRQRFEIQLRRELELFRELETIQATALQSVQSGTFADLEGLLARQREVLAGLERTRGSLPPLLQEWEALPEDARRTLRDGPLGALLREVEEAAGRIQERHRGQFEAPSTGAAEESGGDLGHRISRYRAGL